MRSAVYFSSKEAREWMLREKSRLREIAIGQVLYTVCLLVALRPVKSESSSEVHRVNGLGNRKMTGRWGWSLK